MPVMDEFKEERAALKHGTVKQKWQYFLDYYKWYVIAAVALLGFAGSWIYQVVTAKDTAFNATLINAFEMTSGEEYSQRFAEYAGIDTGEYDVIFDSSMHIDLSSMGQDTYTATQRLMVYVAAGEIDVVLSDAALIEQYAYSETFEDLRTLLTEEQIERYEPYFFYLDQAVMDAIDEAQAEPNYDYTSIPAHPDPRKPEDMERPVPVGIYLEGAQSLGETYYFGEEDVVLAVAATSKNREAAAKFIDFVTQE